MIPAPRWTRILWIVSAVIGLGLTAVWALKVGSNLSIDEQRNLVPESTMWGMHACMVAIIAGLAGIAVPVARIIGRRNALVALGLAIGGYLACGLAPRTTRIFFDEHIYRQIGQTIAHTGRAEGANYARVEYGQFEMYNPWTNKQPNGLPYLLSWIYRVAGVSEASSHFLNRALVGLAAAAIFLGLRLVPWRLPNGAALAAAVLFIFTPLVLWWGHTVAAEPAAAATTAFAFLAACIHVRLRDTATAQGQPASALMLAGTIAFAAYFRPESLLAFPMVATILWSTDDRFIEDVSAWGALFVAAALATPNLLHLWSMRTEDWGARDGRRFAFDFIQSNLHSNAGYFVNSQWFPIAGGILGIVGALWLLARNRTAGIALATWFLLSWGIFVLFYAGGYHYGASSRYGVVSCAPVAVFMGIGLTALFGRLKRLPILCFSLAGVLLINWVAAMHFVPTLSREAIEALADADFVITVKKTLPEGSLVISPDPCMWLLEGVNSSQFYTVEHMVKEEMRELANQYPGGIYIHWSFWHNAEQGAADVTAKLLVDTHATLFARTESQAFKLAVYRIDTPEALERFGGPPQPPRVKDTDLDRSLERARAAAAQPTPVKP